MKYKSCYWITSGINFVINQVRFCCYEYLHSKSDNVIFPFYKGEILDYDKYFEIKNKYVELAKTGNIHPNCRNCVYLSENDWSDENYFDHFIFNYWTHCNSKCIYCQQAYFPIEQKKQYYNIYPVLKDMKKNKLLRATFVNAVVFGGGEPTLLKEFEKLLKFFMNEGFNNIRVNSSGIKYSNLLAQTLKNNYSSLVISPDSGTQTTYEKIKRVKTFHKVWDNIAKYAKKSKYTKNLKVKYIIIPGINSSYIEIDNFFNQLLKSNVCSVAMSIEQGWYNRYYPNFPDFIFDIIQYFINKTNQYGLELELYCEAKSLLQTKLSEQNTTISPKGVSGIL